MAPLLPDVDIDLEMHDRSDVPVVSAALTGAADIIVTGDRGLLEDADLGSWLEQRGVRLQRPAEFVDRFGG